MTKLDNFERPPLIRDGVYDHLRKEILQGKFVAGQRLRERELSEQLQVSRTPIREALKQLVQDGMLESTSRGIQIRSYSLAEAIDIYEVRELLELKAAYLAAKNATASEVKQLQQHLDETAQLKQDDYAEHIQSDLNFHSYIAKLSGNQALFDMIASLTGRLINLRVLTRNEIRSTLSHEQHTSIVQAIASGHAAEAEAAMLQHIKAFKSILRSRLQVENGQASKEEQEK